MAPRSTPATHWKQQVARIRVGSKTGDDSVGSGLLISARHVLTSWHVIEVDGRLAAGIEVDLPHLARPLTQIAASRSGWWRHPELDVAIVELVSSVQGAREIDVLLSEPRTHVGAETCGFARGTEASGLSMDRAALPFDVTALTESQPGDLLHLTPSGSPDVWKGMSGAPVIFEEQLLGIICAKNTWKKNDRLLAVPLVRVRVEVLRATGREDSQARTRLHEMVVAVLTRDLSLCGILAAHMRASDGPNAVASALLDATERELLGAAELVQQMRTTEPSRVQLVKDVVQHILPTRPIWKRLLSSCECQFARSGVRTFAVPFLTEALLETLVAAGEGRRCAFAVVGGRVVGKGLVPTGPDRGPDANGARLASALIEEIFRQQGGDLAITAGADRVLSSVASIFKREMVDAKLRAKFVQEHLERRARDNDPDAPPLYVMLCDSGGGEADKYLDNVARRLAEQLPALRIYRLTLREDDPAVGDLVHIDVQISELYNPTRQ